MTALYELSGVAKFFQRGADDRARARRGRPRDRGGRVRRARGPERLRQDDAAADPRRARPSERRHASSSTGRDLVQLPDRAARRAPAALVRLRLPAVQPDPDADRGRERRGEARAGRRHAASARARSCSPRSGSPSAPTICPRTCRAASSSASRSRARSRSSRASCSPTSRPGNLDSATGGEIIDLLASLAAEHGSTVIVATHDASLAARAPRRIAMRDGKLVPAAALA